MNPLDTKCISAFKSKFHDHPSIIANAPGRINLIGEHTDYNGGLVLPAAVDKSFTYVFGENNSDTVNLYALDLDQSYSFVLTDLSKTPETWVNFIKGILDQFRQKGVQVKGFDCVLASTIPIGSGMSSSAGLECGFLEGVNSLFNLELKKWEMITLSQKSNHEYMGVKGGIMDQFASLFGKKDHAILLDCKTKEFQYIPVNTNGYDLVLINTNVKHDHVTGGYNNGPKECAEAFQVIKNNYFPDLETLSDLPDDQLSNIELPAHLMQRVRFVLNENERVRQFEKALASLDYPLLGQLLYASHQGLKEEYKVSCDELDLLVSLAQDRNVLGSRMMGGGFGGCTINLISSASKTEDLTYITTKYKEQTSITPDVYEVTLSEGATTIHL